MLERLDTNARNQLFDIIIVWLKDRKVYYIYYFIEFKNKLNSGNAWLPFSSEYFVFLSPAKKM
jgi:hypothetical protein